MKWQPRGTSRSCYKCGRPGHLKHDCRVKVSCSCYGKVSHIKANGRANLKEVVANVGPENDEPKQSKWE